VDHDRDDHVSDDADQEEQQGGQSVVAKSGKSRSVAFTEIKPATEAERAAQRRADEQAQNALPATRNAAEKWGATTAAVFTALGFASIVQGRNAFERLTEEWGIGAGVAALGAFLLALAAIVVAALAAQGTPRDGMPTGPELVVFEIAEAARARARLQRSRRLTVAAICFVVAALGVLWYGPAKDSSYVVIPHAGAPVCVENPSPPRAPEGLEVIKVDECSTTPSR
jgi:hypothetical protein